MRRRALKEKNFFALPLLSSFSLSSTRQKKTRFLTSRVAFAVFQQLDARDGAKRREERGELGLRGVVGELEFFVVVLLLFVFDGNRKKMRGRGRRRTTTKKTALELIPALAIEPERFS